MWAAIEAKRRFFMWKLPRIRNFCFRQEKLFSAKMRAWSQIIERWHLPKMSRLYHCSWKSKIVCCTWNGWCLVNYIGWWFDSEMSKLHDCQLRFQKLWKTQMWSRLNSSQKWHLLKLWCLWSTLRGFEKLWNAKMFEKLPGTWKWALPGMWFIFNSLQRFEIMPDSKMLSQPIHFRRRLMQKLWNVQNCLFWPEILHFTKMPRKHNFRIKWHLQNLSNRYETKFWTTGMCSVISPFWGQNSRNFHFGDFDFARNLELLFYHFQLFVFRRTLFLFDDQKS